LAIAQAFAGRRQMVFVSFVVIADIDLARSFRDGGIEENADR